MGSLAQSAVGYIRYIHSTGRLAGPSCAHIDMNRADRLCEVAQVTGIAGALAGCMMQLQPLLEGVNRYITDHKRMLDTVSFNCRGLSTLGFKGSWAQC